MTTISLLHSKKFSDDFLISSAMRPVFCIQLLIQFLSFFSWFLPKQGSIKSEHYIWFVCLCHPLLTSPCGPHPLQTLFRSIAIHIAQVGTISSVSQLESSRRVSMACLSLQNSQERRRTAKPFLSCLPSPSLLCASLILVYFKPDTFITMSCCLLHPLPLGGVRKTEIFQRTSWEAWLYLLLKQKFGMEPWMVVSLFTWNFSALESEAGFLSQLGLKA